MVADRGWVGLFCGGGAVCGGGEKEMVSFDFSFLCVARIGATVFLYLFLLFVFCLVLHFGHRSASPPLRVFSLSYFLVRK